VPNPMLGVLVADDDPLVRAGLRTILSAADDLRVVGEAGDGAAAIAGVAAYRPDVVLMDLRMPEMEGIEAIGELRRVAANIRILVLTNYDEEDYIFRALKAGAMGYLLKNTPQEEIIHAVEMVHQNQSCIPPNIARRLTEAIASEELSQRELEVLKLAADGLTNKAIADRLFISAKTARNHVTSCLGKLCASDRTEAVTIALRRGLIRLSK